MTSLSPPACRTLLAHFRRTRERTLDLIQGLGAEDLQVQAMADASPGKWHLAHTSWFHEAFVLQGTPYRAGWDYLFNSYYQQIGERHARPSRGLVTRPTLDEVLEYRNHVDEAIAELLDRGATARQRELLRIGIEHECQHQELLITDLKYLLFQNPLRPAWRNSAAASDRSALAELVWRDGANGPTGIGASDTDDFSYDNEHGRHTQWLAPHQIAQRPVSNGEYLAFIEDQGYQRPELWLSDGWDHCCAQQWCAPLYWEKHDDQWLHFTVNGMQPLSPAAAVCHISQYEADAYARWAGARLPTEFEWEASAAGRSDSGLWLDDGAMHPGPLSAESWMGNVWEWTASAYLPYPGFRVAEGAVGEYNGKFMSGQMVLRGGSCASPREHLRSSYRNFFPPHARWQFSGLRLARDPT